MAWYNNLGDFAGDIKDIATGHNPANTKPPVPIPNAGPSNPYGFGAKPTGQTTSTSTQPVPTVSNGGQPITIPNADGGFDPTSVSSWAGLIAKYGGNILGAVTDFAKQHGQSVVEAYNIYNAAQRQGEADKHAKAALEGTTQRFNDKAGLRSSGIAGLMNPGSGADLSSLKSMAGAQSGNPFAGAVTPHLPIPNAGPPKPPTPQVFDRPNPMAGAALPIAAPPGPPGTSTGQRPQAPYDPKLLPLPIGSRLGG